MNNSMIIYILGQVIRLEGLLLAIPCAASIAYRENETFAFLAVIVVCIVLGTVMTIKKPANQTIYLKEGCIATAFSWIILSVFGAFPYYISGEIPVFIDALFESMSGLTTTGASVLSDIEGMSRGMLLWRCFSQWIGGMGVLVFLLAIIPMNGGSHMNLMKAESPGPSVGKLVPKVKYTARILYTIYFAITILTLIFLLLGHMPFYDALCTAFGTAGTGGFGTKNDSLAGYSPYIQWVVIVFMTLSGVNFNFYYYMLFRNFRKALSMEEVRAYFIIMIVSVLVIFANIYGTVSDTGTAVREAVFQVTSICSTTGYTTVNYDNWNQLCQAVLMILMFIGACAGSTGCGMKVSRLVIMVKTVTKELGSYFHPKNVKKINVDGKPVEHETVRAVNVYFITFMILFVISVLLVAVEDRDMVTSFTSVVACMNNIGVGLDGIGPGHSFVDFSVLSKLVLMFDMLAGRLELFPLLIIFSPVIYRDMAYSAARGLKRRLKKS